MGLVCTMGPVNTTGVHTTCILSTPWVMLAPRIFFVLWVMLIPETFTPRVMFIRWSWSWHRHCLRREARLQQGFIRIMRYVSTIGLILTAGLPTLSSVSIRWCERTFGCGYNKYWCKHHSWGWHLCERDVWSKRDPGANKFHLSKIHPVKFSPPNILGSGSHR